MNAKDTKIKELEERIQAIESSQAKPVRMPKRCKMTRADNGELYWLPQCYGGAVYGDKHHCTCD